MPVALRERQKIMSGSHPDVMVVKPESKLRQIKIGQIVRRPNSRRGLA